MPVQEIGLQVDAGASFVGKWSWIGGNAGVDIRSAAATATFRQSPGDTPLLTLTNTPTQYGSILYLDPVPNFPWVPPELASDPDVEPTLVTLYPFAVIIAVAGIALIQVVPFLRWKLNLLWPDGTSTDLIHGNVEVDAV